MRRLLSPKYIVVTVALALLLVVVPYYMWQARTTKDGSGGAPCFHAHLGPHLLRPGPRYDQVGKLVAIVESGRQPRGNADLTLLRHYHPSTQLGYCAGHTWESHAWRYGGGQLGFEVREYKPTDRWPDEFGSYVFVKHTHEQLFPIYVGYTDNLKESLSNPHDHEKIDCINEHGATHIHARLGNSLYASEWMTYMIRGFHPPCNEDRSSRLDVGTGLIEGHVVAWTGKSGRGYTYTNTDNYDASPGNFAFAKYEKVGLDPVDWSKPRFEWVLLYVGETDDLRQRLTAPGKFEALPWECSVSVGATHIFTHADEGTETDRRGEVDDLNEQHHPPCNRLDRLNR